MISVIIPCYNAEKFINSCYGSINNQSNKDLEIIFVNDGSSDGTKELVQEIMKNDARVKLINKENGGVSSARNAGLGVALGEWVHFMDVDDTISGEFYDVSASYDVVMCDFVVKGKRKTSLSKIMKTNPAVWNKLYLKSKIERPFVEGVSMSEDLVFNYWYFQNVNNIKYNNDATYNYMIENGAAVLDVRKLMQGISIIKLIPENSETKIIKSYELIRRLPIALIYDKKTVSTIMKLLKKYNLKKQPLSNRLCWFIFKLKLEYILYPIIWLYVKKKYK